MLSYLNILQIRQEGKGIPYGGTGELREDGNANYGFKNLKGRLDRIGEIPELVRDEALHDVVVSLNQPESAFATVGCVSAVIHEEQGHRVTGYVEFAFDSAERVADAANYFPVFFHFDRTLDRLNFNDRVQFHWELMGASFHACNVDGFTIAVTINTDYYSTAKEAGVAWANGLDFLACYLANWPPAGGTPLFTDAMDPTRSG